MKKLICSFALTYRHCLFIIMTGVAKPSEEKTPESELSVLVIPVDDGKKEKKDFLALSSVMAEFVVDSKEGTQISGDGEGVEQKQVVAEKDVSEGTFPVGDTKKRSNS